MTSRDFQILTQASEGRAFVLRHYLVELLRRELVSSAKVFSVKQEPLDARMLRGMFKEGLMNAESEASFKDVYAQAEALPQPSIQPLIDSDFARRTMTMVCTSPTVTL